MCHLQPTVCLLSVKTEKTTQLEYKRLYIHKKKSKTSLKVSNKTQVVEIKEINI